MAALIGNAAAVITFAAIGLLIRHEHRKDPR